jgi:5-methyltetrahydropteroyltriglutamate--homocysteine methyltransferase
VPGKLTEIFGALDLGTSEVETPEQVAERLTAALAHLPAERLIAAPDCGMKYFDREIAYGKLKALADGAAIVRNRLTGEVA